MITVLRQIKGHDRVESLQIMLEVIEILEKNYANDDGVPVKAWDTLYYWLEEYYCEIKKLFIKERGF